MTTDSAKNVLVVGGAGYLGSVLVGKLLDYGYAVRVLDMLMFGGESLTEYQRRDNFELLVGDIRNIPVVTRAIQGMTAVVHLAAVVGDPACRSLPFDSVETNYLAAKMLAEACKYHKINRFLYASTCSVYGASDGISTEKSPTNPVSLYAKTKMGSEEAIMGMADSDFAPCALRMATLHGWSPRMRFDLVVNTMTMTAARKGIVSINGGGQWRPLLHVEDAAEAYVRCLSAPLQVIRGQIFNVGSSSQNFRILEVGQMVKHVLPDARVIVKPEGNDARNYRVSFDKLERELEFRPKFTVENSIVKIADCLANNRDMDVDDDRYYNHNEA